MPRPKLKARQKRLSDQLRFRAYPEEKEGLRQLADILGTTPSRIIRRLVREAINGGPDYFEDGRGDIRRMHYELMRIGRNLNQFARAVNRGERVMSGDLRRAFNACTVQTEAVKQVYFRAVQAAARRAWRPLYREVGLPSPFDAQEEPPAGKGPGSDQQRGASGDPGDELRR